MGNGPGLNSGDTNPSNEMTFRSAAGLDVTAPQISNFRVTSMSDSTTIIAWTTDEPGNSQVQYDMNSNNWEDYRFSENDMAMVTEHSVVLTGLSPSTLYFIRASSTDSRGNNYLTSLNDKYPSMEINTFTLDANAPSIKVYPDMGYSKVDATNNMTLWEEITDADGNRVQPDTVRINENDDDDAGGGGGGGDGICFIGYLRY